MKTLLTHTWLVFFLIIGAALFGCDSAVAPEGDDLDRKADNPIVGSVTGVIGAAYADREPPPLAFTATIGIDVHADGSARGSGISLVRSSPPSSAQGRAACASFSADGKEAWMVVRIRKSDWPSGQVDAGDLLGLRIRDNGDGDSAVLDQASKFHFLKLQAAPYNTAKGWCSGQPTVDFVSRSNRSTVQVLAPFG